METRITAPCKEACTEVNTSTSAVLQSWQHCWEILLSSGFSGDEEWKSSGAEVLASAAYSTTCRLGINQPFTAGALLCTSPAILAARKSTQLLSELGVVWYSTSTFTSHTCSYVQAFIYQPPFSLQLRGKFVAK